MLALRALMAAAGSAGDLDFALNAPDATVIAAYRADEGVTIATGVSQWDDRTGNGHHMTQATASNQPAFIADGGADFNNQPVIRPDGSNDFLGISGLGAGFLPQPYTEIAIFKATLANAAEKTIINQWGTTTDRGLQMNASELVQMGATTLLTGTSGNDIPIVLEGLFNGASSALRVNSTLEASGNAGTGDITDGWSIGAISNATEPFGGDIAEIIIVDGELTEADRVYLALYAAQRYGLAIPFPQVLSVTATNSGSALAEHEVNIPAVQAGQALVLVVRNGGDADVDEPGWELIGADNFDHVFLFVATADAAATTITVGTSVASWSIAAQVIHLSMWFGQSSGIEISTTVSGSSTSPNPPNVTAPWGALRNLFIEIITTAPDDVHLTVASANYSNRVSTVSGGGTGSGGGVGTARRELESASDNPGTATIGSTDVWHAQTMVVRPIG